MMLLAAVLILPFAAWIGGFNGLSLVGVILAGTYLIRKVARGGGSS